MRAHRGTKVDEWVTFQLDGEAVQIEPFFDVNIRNLLREKKIIVSKFSASTTEIEQPCDAWKLFSSQKAVLATLADAVPEELEGLQMSITDAFKNNQDLYGKFQYSHYKCLSRGVLKVYQAMEKTISKRVIKDSFKTTGIAPYNIDTVMANCFTQLDRAAQINIKRNLDWLSRRMEENGELFTEDYDHCGIEDNIER